MRSILYLHGFHSSPQSVKANIFRNYVEQELQDIKVIAPQLDVHPEPSVNIIDELIAQNKDSLIGVVGSSLGGYLATYVHNKYQLPAVVINPAVRPFELLSDYLGEQIHPITGENYELTSAHMKQLKQLYREKVHTPAKVWLLQQEQDEVLDHRQALSYYQDCKITFEQGGSHAFDGFERFPADIVQFLIENSDLTKDI